MIVFHMALGDLCALGIAIGFGLFMLYHQVRVTLRQRRCDHTRHRFNETQACDAICCGCGKNLGFIKYVRDQRRGNEGQKT